MRAFGNPVFSHPAVERLKDLPIREIVTTDTIPIPPHKRLPSLQVLAVSPPLGEVICRAYQGRSVGEMFHE